MVNYCHLEDYAMHAVQSSMLLLDKTKNRKYLLAGVSRNVKEITIDE